MKYWVSEIFTSIQGEGQVIGTPSNFVRLAGCNLRCVWCDTKYSWLRSDGREMDLDDIVNSLDPRVKVTTITGGEPLLQDLLPLAHRLKQMDHYIIVETSGTVRPDPELRKMVDVFSVSPKLSNAGFRFPYDLNEDWATYYKFVILNPEKDLEEVTGIVEKFRLKPSKIILQPDGNRKDYENALRELADAVTKNRLPYRVLPQFHRILSYR